MGDAGVAHLKGLTNLEELTLDRTAITDAGLAHLLRCPAWSSYRVQHTQGHRGRHRRDGATASARSRSQQLAATSTGVVPPETAITERGNRALNHARRHQAAAIHQRRRSRTPRPSCCRWFTTSCASWRDKSSPVNRPDRPSTPPRSVHEAYRADGRRRTTTAASPTSGHFFAVAAEAMRHILVDKARRKRREKHGGRRRRVELTEAPPHRLEAEEDLLALDEALNQPRQRRPGSRRPGPASLFRGPLRRGGGRQPGYLARHRIPALDVRPRLAPRTNSPATSRHDLFFLPPVRQPAHRKALWVSRARKGGTSCRPDFKQAKDIFLAAVEKTNPEDASAYLREACGEDDALLRRQVDALLRRHEDAGSFLEQPAFDERTGPTRSLRTQSPPRRRQSRPEAEAVGTKIGPYKLVQQLGEGGMGTVWVAEQTEPVKRRVALKLIKPGLDSAQVIRRFEAERQALALMDHTNIAKVLDAGTTAAGRPYFVMELVKGVPITRYCDELQLPLRERLELFVPVCQAIQHAHQKGIIHRDIKPSNVLVCMQDGKPVPKVIDFGVAKALHQRLTNESMYTEIGQLIGTLEYMSPEQAELSALDIDTRADVYALGVLLYELLTGTTPLDKSRLRNAAFAELLRMIKEEEPPRPSTRLTESQGIAARAWPPSAAATPRN